VITCAQKWLTRFTPFFTAEERKHAGVQHRLFFAQVEFCDNLIFRRRAAVDALEQRLLDANRTIGQPNKLTLIFGRRITRHHAGKLQTVIDDLNLPNPVIRSHYRKGFLKQYVRDRFLLRTEPATNNVYTDYGIGKAVGNVRQLRQRLDGIIDRYLDVPGTSPTHPTHASSQRQTHPWPGAGSAPTVGPHALPGARLRPRGRRHFHHPRLIPANPAGTPDGTERVQAWISPL
jgi:hypothetical protein